MAQASAARLKKSREHVYGVFAICHLEAQLQQASRTGEGPALIGDALVELDQLMFSDAELTGVGPCGPAAVVIVEPVGPAFPPKL